MAQGAGVSAPFLLTFLDQKMIIGRSNAPSGTFIFTREAEQAC